MSPLQILLVVAGALVFGVGIAGLGAALIRELGPLAAVAAVIAGIGLIFFAVW